MFIYSQRLRRAGSDSRAQRIVNTLAALAGVLAFVAASGARADVVKDWDIIAASTITPAASVTLPPPVTEAEQRPIFQVDLATLHVAIYDAVNAIDRRFEPYAIVLHAGTRGASEEAAAVGAAYNVLKGLFPNRSVIYQHAFDTYVAAAAGDPAKARGLAIGAEVAGGILALRQNDGRMTAVSYATTGQPGDWVPGPPPLLYTYIPFMKPFAVRSAAQFRAPGPAALTSQRYADDFNETKTMGAAVNSPRTAEMSDLALFYSESSATYFPRNWRQFDSDSQSIADNARLMALIWVINADTQLGCVASKYHYRFWRPRTAVPQADLDGNPETIADATWASFIATPNHPEYPALHACNGGSFAETLRQFYGTDHLNLTLTSTKAVLHPTHQFTTTSEMPIETANARVYGGVHFRKSTRDGVTLGRRTARWISRHYFRPLHERDEHEYRDHDRSDADHDDADHDDANRGDDDRD